MRLGLVARHLLERAGEHHGLAGDRRVASSRSSMAVTVTCSSRSVERFAVVRLVEELDDRVRHHLADPVDGIEVLIGLRLRPPRRCGRRRRATPRSIRSARASSFAVVSPTWRMPSAKMKPVERDGAPRLDRREQVAHRQTRRSPPPPRSLMLRLRCASVKMSAGSLIQPRSKNSSICFSPRPSMSKARRETKCFRCSTAWARADELAGAAAHHVLLAGCADRPRAPRGCRRPGRSCGNSIGLGAASAASPARRRAICGMTSPARWMTHGVADRARPCGRSRPRCAAWRSRRRRRRRSPARAAPPGSARRCGRPGCRCR